MATNARRTVAWWALALTTALLLSGGWSATHRELDLDEFEHAHATWLVSRGEVPYRDFFEHHTPALYLLAAPLYAHAPVETDPAAAVRVLITSRLVMWLGTAAILGAVYALGAQWGDWTTGITASFLLASSAQFLYIMNEFRPDVPAVLCLTIGVGCLAAAARANRVERTVYLALGGIAFGVAYLFTQKILFAAPGIAIGLALDQRRFESLATAAFGAIAPVAAMAWWFASRGALGAFYYYTVPFNARLNAEHFSPWPFLIRNIVQQPVLYLAGGAALLAAVRRRQAPPGGWPLIAAGLSLIAGLFVIGKTYDQYYALLLPLLAVAGAAWAQGIVRRPALAAVVMFALSVQAVAYSARWYEPIAPQLADLAWVTTHTRATDSYLGGSPNGAMFRPHAWFYFFMSGPFATDREWAQLADDLESGRIRPTLFVDTLFEHAPSSLLAYVRAHYESDPAVHSSVLRVRNDR